MLKLLITASTLIYGVHHAAGTSCYDLQQTQLLSLNERMTQMLDTISSLLPQPLKKSTPPVTPTPSVDYVKSSNAYETYYSHPPAYITPPQTPQIMYVSPSYIPAGVYASPPIHPTPISSTRPYRQVEIGPQTDYAYSTLPNLIPQLSQNQYEHYPVTPFTNPIPISQFSPPSYQLHPYSISQPEHLVNYNYPSEYSIPNISSPPPSPPSFSLPVYAHPGAYSIS